MWRDDFFDDMVQLFYFLKARAARHEFTSELSWQKDGLDLGWSGYY